MSNKDITIELKSARLVCGHLNIKTAMTKRLHSNVNTHRLAIGWCCLWLRRALFGLDYTSSSKFWVLMGHLRLVHLVEARQALILYQDLALLPFAIPWSHLLPYSGSPSKLLWQLQGWVHCWPQLGVGGQGGEVQGVVGDLIIRMYILKSSIIDAHLLPLQLVRQPQRLEGSR